MPLRPVQFVPTMSNPDCKDNNYEIDICRTFRYDIDRYFACSAGKQIACLSDTVPLLYAHEPLRICLQSPCASSRSWDILNRAGVDDIRRMVCLL